MGTARGTQEAGGDPDAGNYRGSSQSQSHSKSIGLRESNEKAACAKARDALAKPLGGVAAKWDRGRVASECEGKCPVCKKVRRRLRRRWRERWPTPVVFSYGFHASGQG